MTKEIRSLKELYDHILYVRRRAKPARETKVTWPVVILFFILGVVLLTASSYFTNERINLIRNGLHAQGVVNSIERKETTCSNGNHGYRHPCTLYVSVISYKNNLQEDQSFKTDIASNRPVYAMDEKVDVLYLPGRPETARVYSLLSMWMVPGISGFFGFMLIYGAIRHSMRLARRNETPL